MSENKVASRGDFRGDFSRDTFDPMKHFSRVLMQQGRVQLDADWNEQVSILLHYMRQLGADLMGPHGAPYPDDYNELPLNEPLNFKIDQAKDSSEGKPNFSIAPGRYYVSGILCEIAADQQVSYRNQPNYPIQKDLGKGTYLVYLDVWERHLSYIEDDDIREKALGGADTATRAKVVWQVKVIGQALLGNYQISKESHYSDFLSALNYAKFKTIKPITGKLKAQAKKTEAKNEPCLTSPDSTYRGTENQLYRVEIHNSSSDTDGPTFKWSRENGSVIFPIRYIADKIISLEHLGRDDRFSLQTGDWVEVLDDDVILRNEALPLLQVKEVDRENLQVTLDGTPDFGVGQNIEKHPYLRRWDHSKKVTGAGVIPVKEGTGDDVWISLEDGVEIQFQKQDAVVYQTGDYWLIPARTATGDVEWPVDPVDHTKPAALPPHGVVHHYAPLAIITVADNKVKENTQGEPDNLIDLRRQLKKGWE